jgi:hypothetical protein
MGHNLKTAGPTYNTIVLQIDYMYVSTELLPLPTIID